jgi:hypothetical protein
LAISRVLVIIAVVIVVGLLAVFLYTDIATSASSTTSSGEQSSNTTSSGSSVASSWVGGSAYPLEVSGTSGIVGQSCINSTSTVYCIGGIDYDGSPRNNVYSAEVSSTGMSGWTSDTAYPQLIGLQSCVTSNGYAYCIGGSYDDAGDDIATSYFAPLTSSGIGSWTQTTPYPVAVDSQSCVSSSGYVYCVGGENETDGTNSTAIPSNSAWYAPISSSGIGTWSHTTAYPNTISFEDCAASSADIFCVGGVDGSNNGVDSVYYAPLSSSGIGTWSSTEAYPSDLYGQTCVITSGNIICVGGIPNGTTSASDSIYSAQISTNGISSWYHAMNYPMGVETACDAAAGNLYCIGGYQDSDTVTADIYYVSIQALLG